MDADSRFSFEDHYCRREIRASDELDSDTFTINAKNPRKNTRRKSNYRVSVSSLRTTTTTTNRWISISVFARQQRRNDKETKTTTTRTLRTCFGIEFIHVRKLDDNNDDDAYEREDRGVFRIESVVNIACCTIPVASPHNTAPHTEFVYQVLRAHNTINNVCVCVVRDAYAQLE